MCIDIIRVTRAARPILRRRWRRRLRRWWCGMSRRSHVKGKPYQNIPSPHFSYHIATRVYLMMPMVSPCLSFYRTPARHTCMHLYSSLRPYDRGLCYTCERDHTRAPISRHRAQLDCPPARAYTVCVLRWRTREEREVSARAEPVSTVSVSNEKNTQPTTSSTTTNMQTE